VRRVSERPLVSRLARVQAEEGSWLASRRHTLFKLDDLTRRLVPLLDGGHDRPALVEQLVGQVGAGSLTVSTAGQPVRDPVQARALLEGVLPDRLEALAQGAVLMG
jgi:methyltransferase-like protein